MTIAIRTLPVAVVIALVCSACGSSSTDSTGASGSLPPGVGSEFQREILADGLVTQAEYERAFDAVVNCMTSQGLVVFGPTPMMADRYLAYAVREGPQSESIMRTCEEEFLDPYINHAWVTQRTPTGAAAENARIDYRDCVRAAGVELADDADYYQIEEAAKEPLNPRTQSCIERYSTTTFILPPH